MVRKLAVVLLAMGISFSYSAASAHCGECGVGDGDAKGHAKEVKAEGKKHHEGHDHDAGEKAEKMAKMKASEKSAHHKSYGYEIGDEVESFTLKHAQSGEDKSLTDVAGEKGTVLIFWNQECPWCTGNGAQDRIESMAAEYKDKGVNFVLIDAGTNNPVGKIVEYAKDVDVPVLINPNSKVAARFDARYTPHTYIINADNELVYQGALEVHKGDDITMTSKNALDEMLAGEAITEAEVIGKGCGLKYAEGARPPKKSAG